MSFLLNLTTNSFSAAYHVNLSYSHGQIFKVRSFFSIMRERIKDIFLSIFYILFPYARL